MEKIDIVIPWVDGNDKNWLREKEKYKPELLADSSVIRYRDWDNLQYLFRGVEKYAPWVNNVFFITWGHKPQWLNVNHPKLRVINHKDYIPERYLPTFNSHTIELNLHRIKDLSEHYIYFNDDTFLISHTKRTDFFKNGKPKDSAVLSVHCVERGIIESHIPVVVTSVINDHFNMKSVIRDNIWKWVFPGYGPLLLLRTACLLPSPRFPGFWQHHLPNSFIKSELEELWKEEYDILDETCSHKFRTANDVSQWLLREWQICKGEFCPRSSNFGKSFHIDRKGSGIIPEIADFIKKQKRKVVVINDGMMDMSEFLIAKQEINKSFELILPQKSSYEV